MKKFQSVRGMQDILAPKSKAFRALEDILTSSVNQFGYHEIKTPILEETGLFIKSIGDGTDIVEKEMYTFVDSKKKEIQKRLIKRKNFNSKLFYKFKKIQLNPKYKKKKSKFIIKNNFKKKKLNKSIKKILKEIL